MMNERDESTTAQIEPPPPHDAGKGCAKTAIVFAGILVGCVFIFPYQVSMGWLYDLFPPLTSAVVNWLYPMTIVILIVLGFTMINRYRNPELQRKVNRITIAIATTLCIASLLVIYLMLARATRVAREATLRSDLNQVRYGIELFKTDTGVYPARLEDLVAPSEEKLTTRVRRGSYKGPYFLTSGGINNTGIPLNTLASGDPDIAHHWTYSPKNGSVRSAVKGVTLEGVRYEDY
ncbi:MAG: hypothetical protein ACYC7E_13975 [Armatimonadota bacterium]